ncbi:hypothetical protein V4F39_21635 [Aquincola sp. MAHUQ-54]|uniref:DUF2169 domain-containing protein n=1 Tax=Aquincola agrisoli TaxID=3119538 RepID=A0AAW9QK60_9BURK
MDRDDLDPTRALDGWNPHRGPRPTDAELTSLLDGWQARGTPLHPLRDGDEPPAQRLALPRLQPRPGEAEPVELDGIGRQAAQRAARWGAADITDIELDWQPAPVAARAPAHPRVLERWEPGAWVAAVRQVAESTTEVHDGPQGPVVETFAALRLIAWWMPTASGAPLGRWPHRVQLQPVETERVPLALLSPLPQDARVWCLHEAAAGEAVDWALVGQLVLLHDTGLRAHQFESLQALVESEREGQYTRLNGGYRWPAAGQPVEQADPADPGRQA